LGRKWPHKWAILSGEKDIGIGKVLAADLFGQMSGNKSAQRNVAFYSDPVYDCFQRINFGSNEKLLNEWKILLKGRGRRNMRTWQILSWQI
jgi:hypothetical protein